MFVSSANTVKLSKALIIFLDQATKFMNGHYTTRSSTNPNYQLEELLLCKLIRAVEIND